ncbi:MAG: SPOR domain-containing protein [Bacteroidota bacterium]
MKAALFYGWMCLLSISFSFQLQAQSSSKDFYYTIHVGAFVKAELSDFQKIRPLGFVYSELFDNSLLRVYLGSYEGEKDATDVLARVRANGYPDAYVTRKDLSQSEQTSMIQLGTAAFSDKIDWDRYALAGPLYVLQVGSQLKILTGTFDDLESAQQRLKIVRRGGFKDAFVKNLNEGLLHKITSFEAGKMLRPASYDALPAEEPSDLVAKGNADLTDDEPVSLVKAGKAEEDPVPPPAEPIPDSYDERFTIKSPSPVPMPAIRKNVKRNSVLELQKVLKKEGAYSSSLDGYYGKGTAAGYDRILQDNSQLRKYRLLTKYTREMRLPSNTSGLQYHINTLADNPVNAVRQLKESTDPVAQVYTAYWTFMTQGQGREVDDLMNAAIKKSFVGKKVKNKPPFDVNLDYSYRSLEQLLQHLACVQSASTTANELPCWMMRQHPKEAATAFGAESGLTIQECDEFVSWPELGLLRTIAADLNPDGTADADQVAAYASQRTRFLLSPSALGTAESKELLAWHNSLWKGLDGWAVEEKLHAKLVLPLRVAYFQSMIRLEDYFMSKKMTAKQARYLAIGTLRSMIDHHLSAYSAG